MTSSIDKITPEKSHIYNNVIFFDKKINKI